MQQPGNFSLINPLTPQLWELMEIIKSSASSQSSFPVNCGRDLSDQTPRSSLVLLLTAKIMAFLWTCAQSCVSKPQALQIYLIPSVWETLLIECLNLCLTYISKTSKFRDYSHCKDSLLPSQHPRRRTHHAMLGITRIGLGCKKRRGDEAFIVDSVTLICQKHAGNFHNIRFCWIIHKVQGSYWLLFAI
jgi:hypothetical protein